MFSTHALVQFPTKIPCRSRAIESGLSTIDAVLPEMSIDPPIRTGRVLSAPTAIEDDCWLGEGCMVLKGVRVGRGSIVGAGAVVNRDVPPYHIVVGAPARAVKRWDAGTQTWVPIEGA